MGGFKHMKIITKFWMGLAILVLLSPLGLILPKHFKAGCAWGKRGGENISSYWSAPIPDYAFKGWEEKSLVNLSLAYIISAVIGIFICVGAVLILGKFLSKK